MSTHKNTCLPEVTGCLVGLLVLGCKDKPDYRLFPHADAGVFGGFCAFVSTVWGLKFGLRIKAAVQLPQSGRRAPLRRHPGPLEGRTAICWKFAKNKISRRRAAITPCFREVLIRPRSTWGGAGTKKKRLGMGDTLTSHCTHAWIAQLSQQGHSHHNSCTCIVRHMLRTQLSDAASEIFQGILDDSLRITQRIRSIHQRASQVRCRLQ
eukprot:1343921-Amorphochlora_amoeboformis.AAC.1